MHAELSVLGGDALLEAKLYILTNALYWLFLHKCAVSTWDGALQLVHDSRLNLVLTCAELGGCAEFAFEELMHEGNFAAPFTELKKGARTFITTIVCVAKSIREVRAPSHHAAARTHTAPATLSRVRHPLALCRPPSRASAAALPHA
jgi:hypothetical protein